MSARHAALAVALAVAALAPVPRTLAAVPFTSADLHGIWWDAHPPTTLAPVGGGTIPFTAVGRKLYAASMEKLRAEASQLVTRDDMRRCLPYGPTRILQQPFPLQTFQSGNLFVIAYEHNHVYEIVYLNEQPDLDRDPTYMGNSVGNWTRDGLQITSTGFKDGTLLDDSGIPHSDKLRIVRTLRRIAAGKQIEIVTTITDPTMFLRPWKVRNVLESRPDARIEEYTCGQGPVLDTRNSSGGSYYVIE
jgi:hypothetical protein